MQDSGTSTHTQPLAPTPAADTRRQIEAYAVRFTGDGGIYFGVWMVNVLLTIITLGLYTPWARRRTVRYFYEHTELAGHALEFTAGIRSMVVGFLLFAGLYIATEFAANMGQEWVFGVVMLGGALLAPWLWASAMRFRLGHTRWRGLRLRFTPPWPKVYGASWPLFALAFVWLIAGLTLTHLFDEARAKLPPTESVHVPTAAGAQTALLKAQANADLARQTPMAAAASDNATDAAADAMAGSGTSTSTGASAKSDAAPTDTDNDTTDTAEPIRESDEDWTDDAETAPLPRPTWTMALVVVTALLLSFLSLIRLDFNYQRLLVNHTRIGGQWGRWKPVFSDFVKIWWATLGVFVLSLLVLAVLMMSLAALAGALSYFGAASTQGGSWAMVMFYGLLAVTTFLALFLSSSPALAYRQARMFHLTWNHIGVGQVARFKSNLRPWRFVRLRLQNIVLNLITLGFYRPFARVAEYRMKADSVKMYLKGNVDQLVGQLEAQEKDGFGDAVADAMGLDLIG